MKHLIIVGARGAGREAFWATVNSQPYKRGEIDVKGFLDTDASAMDGKGEEYPPILCAPEDYQVEQDDVFVIGLGDGHQRKRYADLIASKGGSFATIIEDGTTIEPTTVIGEGTVILSNSFISCNVTIGKHVLIHPCCVFGHDAVARDYTTFSSLNFLGGGAVVEEFSTLHPYSMVLPHKKVGRNVKATVGSVVMQDVEEGISIHGNPASKMGIADLRAMLQKSGDNSDK